MKPHSNEEDDEEEDDDDDGDYNEDDHDADDDLQQHSILNTHNFHRCYTLILLLACNSKAFVAFLLHLLLYIL